MVLATNSFAAFEGRSLAWIRDSLGGGGQSVSAGVLHEDAATFSVAGRLAACVDAHVAGVHFPESATGASWPGFRAVQATLSDLAATGARPTGLLISIVWPWPELTEIAFQTLYGGIIEAAQVSNVPIIGGNISGGKEVAIHCTALGVVEGTELLTIGRPGDILAVSGAIGDSAVGLRLQSEETPAAADDVAWQTLVETYRKPRAEVAWSLTAKPFLRGATDISDGLPAEMERLCRLSRCGAALYRSRLPRSDAWHKYVQGGNPKEIWGSDDYRLLVTVPPANWVALGRQLEKIGRKVYSVGLLNSGVESLCIDD